MVYVALGGPTRPGRKSAAQLQHERQEELCAEFRGGLKDGTKLAGGLNHASIVPVLLAVGTAVRASDMDNLLLECRWLRLILTDRPLTIALLYEFCMQPAMQGKAGWPCDLLCFPGGKGGLCWHHQQ